MVRIDDEIAKCGWIENVVYKNHGAAIVNATRRGKTVYFAVYLTSEKGRLIELDDILDASDLIGFALMCSALATIADDHPISPVAVYEAFYNIYFKQEN